MTLAATLRRLRYRHSRPGGPATLARGWPQAEPPASPPLPLTPYYVMPADITATLARFSLTPADLLTAAPKAAQVGRYRGTAAGWIPAGGPRPAAEAARLITLWQRIDPAATLRARPL